MVRPASRRWGEALVPAGVLLGLLCVFFWDAVFRGHLLAPIDLFYGYDPIWNLLAPDDLGNTSLVESNFVLLDVVDQFYPWRAYVGRWLAQGVWPFWNADILTGVSLVGNGQSALFYPLNLLTYPLPLNTSFTVSTLGKLLVAGLGTFAYLRLLGRSRAAAYFGAIAFMLSGFLIAWANLAIASVAVWLPALLALIELSFRSRQIRWTGLLALVTGAQFLGGHFETSFHLFLLCTVYLTYLTISTRRQAPSQQAWRGLSRAVAGAVLGLGIGAIQAVPFLQHVAASSVGGSRAELIYASPTPFLDPRFFVEWITLPTIIFPRFLGTPAELHSSGYQLIEQATEHASYTEYIAYVGTLTLLLAAFGAWAGRRDGRTRLWLAIGLISLAVAWRAPILGAVNYLPVLQLTVQDRLRLTFTLAVAVLAAAGLDYLIACLRCPGGSGRRRLRRLSWGLAAFSGLALAFTLGGYVLLSVSPETGVSLFSPVSLLFRDRLAPSNWRMYLPPVLAAGLALAILLIVRRSAWRRWAAWLVPAATAFELMAYGIGYNPTVDPARVFPPNPAIDFLREHAGAQRVAGLGMTLLPNSSLLWGLHDLRGYENVVPSRLHELLWRIDGKAPGDPFNQRIFLSNADSRLLDHLGVHFLLSVAGTPLTSQPEPGRFRQALVTQARPWPGETLPRAGVVVYENSRALPRAYFVGQASVATDLAMLRYLVRKGAFDPAAEVILESDQRPPLDGLRPGASEVAIVVDRPDRISIRAVTDGDGYLILSDTYDEEWIAQVDGVPAPIYRANYAFRAVRIGPGVHQVDFHYRPAGLAWGAAITIASLILVGLAGILRRQIQWLLERGASEGSRATAGRRSRWYLLVAGCAAGAVGLAAWFIWVGARPPLVVEGSLLKDKATGAIYRYEAGHKRWVTSTDALDCLQQPGQAVISTIPLDNIPEGGWIQDADACRLPPPVGTFVHPDGDPAIYLSTGASLRAIPNPTTLRCLARGRPLHVQPVSSDYPLRLPTGPPVPEQSDCPE